MAAALPESTPPSLARAIARFDPSLPLEQASLPPTAWYVDPAMLELERSAVFTRTWQAVGRSDQVRTPGDYFAGTVAGEPYVVLRDQAGQLRAYSNVCRHHAAEVAQGEGRCTELVCPYHGWSYGLDGGLKKAPQLGGVRDFKPAEQGLPALAVAEVGPLVFVQFAGQPRNLTADLAPLTAMLAPTGWDSLKFVARRSYELACNWKVYVDNYLDGGYHVAHLHRGLAAQLDAASYQTELFERFSVQRCGAAPPGESSGEAADSADFGERLGDGAIYAWLYPNFMINRYGPIMDTNWIVPLSQDRTLTVFDYYFEETEGAEAREFIERSLAASHAVQLEDVDICESVQRGLRSALYDRGRYGVLEASEHQFHGLLHRDLTG